MYLILFTIILVSADVPKKKDIQKKAPANKGTHIKEPVFNSNIYFYETGTKNNTSIVLVHGVGSDASKIWSNLIPLLEKEYHVITFDLPGFGRSEKKNELYSPKYYARFIKWIVDNFAKKRVYVIGHSMGGAISLYFAGDYPLSLQGLILVDAAGILHRAAFSKNLAELKVEKRGILNFIKKPLDSFNYFIKTTIENFDKKVMPEDISIVLESPLLREKIFGGDPQKIAGMALIQTDFGKIIDKVKVPVYIIWGKADPIAPYRTGKMLASNLKNAGLHGMENIGHNPMLESADVFNTLIINSLNSNLKDRGHVLQEKISGSPSKKVRGIDSKDQHLFTGSYDTIEIKNSRNIKIVNVHARKIIVENSWIKIENSIISSDETGLNITDSVVTVTGAVIKGKVAVFASNSKLDLAGVKIEGEEAAVKSYYESTIVFSVCRVKSPYNNKYIHKILKVHNENPL